MSLKGKLNIYTCDECCKHIVTRDLDVGVTPFSLNCRATPHCKGMMYSSMYRVFDPGMAEDFVWYRPSAAEVVPPSHREHVANGGLLIREADPTAARNRAREGRRAQRPGS